eukprot:6325465-Prymnesium_polylepis.2
MEMSSPSYADAVYERSPGGLIHQARSPRLLISCGASRQSNCQPSPSAPRSFSRRENMLAPSPPLPWRQSTRRGVAIAAAAANSGSAVVAELGFRGFSQDERGSLLVSQSFFTAWPGGRNEHGERD